jgi:phosphatidylinositol-4,5-bisphosphate 3-kinase
VKSNIRHIEVDIAIVTSADEVIKTIIRLVYETANVKLRTLDYSSQFVLQVKGLKEYITGSSPLL